MLTHMGEDIRKRDYGVHLVSGTPRSNDDKMYIGLQHQHSEVKFTVVQRVAQVDLQHIAQADLHGRYLGQVCRFSQAGQFRCLLTTERACVDEFATERKRQFCRIYKLSEKAQSLLIPKQQQEPTDNSPSKPFYNNPSLGAETILRTVFRARGKLASGMGAEVFSCWVACPSGTDHEALAFTAGHCFADKLTLPYSDSEMFDFREHNFSELVGCFGSDVGPSEFNTLGFACSLKPLVIANETEDSALFEIIEEKMNQMLLPCSAEEECGSNQAFMATFSYPCTQTFLAEAYEELVESKKNHGIKELYTILGMNNQDLFKLLSKTFQAFPDGVLVCSPGALKIVDGAHCYYKCSTVGGSSGGPVVPTHLPGYTVGIHDGAVQDEDYNISTSTDSPAFVACYSKYVLPKLYSKDSGFWIGWNLAPFERWLKKHNLKWESNRKRKRELDEDEVDCVTPPPTISSKYPHAY